MECGREAFRGRCSRRHAELLEDVLEVLANRMRRDEQRVADLTVRLPFAHEREDIGFSLGQL